MAGQHNPVHRFGDLLPLPVPHAPPRPHSGSRAALRRWHRERLVHFESCETVFGLNSLSGHAESSWPEGARNAAQRSSLSLIHKLHSRRVWPTGSVMCPRAALKALLRQDTGYSSVPVGGPAPYRRGAVSLPHDQAGAPRLVDLLPVQERAELESFSDCMLLGAEERGPFGTRLTLSITSVITTRASTILRRGLLLSVSCTVLASFVFLTRRGSPSEFSLFLRSRAS